MFEDMWDNFWRDRHGHIVIWQMPNAWLIGWAVFTVLSLFFNGRVADVFTWVASGALIVWAVLEVKSGVNWFRRCLGAFILIYALITLFKSF